MSRPLLLVGDQFKSMLPAEPVRFWVTTRTRSCALCAGRLRQGEGWGHEPHQALHGITFRGASIVLPNASSLANLMDFFIMTVATIALE